MRKTYLPLSDEDRITLIIIKKNPFRHKSWIVARILLYKADGMTFQEIADKLAISTATSTPLCFRSFAKGGVDLCTV